MKCKFCAEEILDDAILCRFCGALKEHGQWGVATLSRKTVGENAPEGQGTIRIAGALFILSALFELISVTSAVPLFGAVRTGSVAVLYHGVYVALFVGMGVGLLNGTRWGYRLIFAGTIFYTLDRLLYVLDRDTIQAQLTEQVGQHRQVFELIPMDSMVELGVLTTALGVISWWGFAFYVYLRRAYFGV